MTLLLPGLEFDGNQLTVSICLLRLSTEQSGGLFKVKKLDGNLTIAASCSTIFSKIFLSS
jgi:hypothetical protein